MENEIVALNTICGIGGHKNIITFLGYGRLPESDYYYIDMALCEFDLHDYIYGKWSVPVGAKFQNSSDLVLVERECRSVLVWIQNVFTIMIHISKGLKFIHEKQFTHRDLKPQNGYSPLCSMLC